MKIAQQKRRASNNILGSLDDFPFKLNKVSRFNKAKYEPKRDPTFNFLAYPHENDKQGHFSKLLAVIFPLSMSKTQFSYLNTHGGGSIVVGNINLELTAHVGRTAALRRDED